jgi:Ankyrin repeats (3 copies)
MHRLPFSATEAEYELQAEQLPAARASMDDARLALARHYDFRDWAALAEFAQSASERGSRVWLFERAVEAVVDGDVPGLQQMLAAHPWLVTARSVRVTPFDPAVHGAMLLHYLGANGVEGYRQRTPPNAVEVMKLLFAAGADPNSLARLYGGECTTLALVISSCHPAQAGLQVALAETLIDHGAVLAPQGTGNYTNPISTALIFGYRDTAAMLARRGAPVDALDVACGLGLIEDARLLLPTADAKLRHRALALAAQSGHAAAIRLLLGAGLDPNQFNPAGFHAHSTPLHQAALAGHLEAVKAFAEYGARLDIEDTIWHGTPLGWAEYGGQIEVAAYLRNRSAR